ncbi:hypothetical protein HOH87_04975 [bacterium]|jgi:hypothetical protein|nr:hypothetical protein [bacterium]
MKRFIYVGILLLWGGFLGIGYAAESTPTSPSIQPANILDLIASENKTVEPLYLPGYFDTNTPVEKLVTESSKIETILGYKSTPTSQKITKKPMPFMSRYQTDSRYPDVQTDGFIELKVGGRDHSSDISKLDAIRNDTIYKKLPNDVLRGSPKFDMRYLISVEGKLDEDLSVSYDIEKEPDFPGKYNIGIIKGPTELTFGDFEETFNTGEFINVKKSLNGVRVKSSSDNWRGTALIGQTKSEPQKYETFGTDNTVYKVGKQFLLEGSVLVYLNNLLLEEGVDYTVDYFEGQVTFSTPKTKIDFIKVIYEFTNPIQDFIPSLSRKTFMGAHYQWRPAHMKTKVTKLTTTISETLIPENEVSFNPKFQLSEAPIVLGSETVSLNGSPLERVTDYLLKQSSGVLSIRNRKISKEDALAITYDYYQTAAVTENILAKGIPGPYYLQKGHILPQDITVTVSGYKAKEFVDYTISHKEGKLYFNYPISYPTEITASYKALEVRAVTTNIEESPLSFGATYLEESSSVKEDLLAARADEIPVDVTGDLNNILVTKFNPIEESRPIKVVLNSEEVPSAQYTVNYYEGTIQLNSLQNVIASQVKISYSYRKSFPSDYSFRGLGLQTYRISDITPPSLPIKFNGIDRIILYPGDIELEKGRDFEVTYPNDGETFQDFELKFLKGFPSQLSDFPGNDTTIKMKYNYTPDSELSQAKTQQKMIDLTMRYNVSDKLKIDAEYAHSYHDFSKSKKDGFESFTKAPENEIYVLAFEPIVEDSETIFINGVSQTRGSDYFMNYEQGEFRFINKTIPDDETVEIFYSYFQTDLPESANANALRVATAYEVQKGLTVDTEFKYIDPQFRSIGELKDEKGTLALKSGVNWAINSTNNIQTHYEKRTKINEQKQTLKTENEFITKSNLGIAGLHTTHSFRHYSLTATGSASAGQPNTESTSYETSYAFGNDELNTKFSGAVSQKIDSPESTTALVDSFLFGYGIQTFYTPKSPLLVKRFNLNPYFFTTTDKADKYLDANDLIKTTEKIGFKTNTTLIDRMDNTLSFEQQAIKLTTPSSSSNDPYYNYSSLTSYAPYRWLTTSYGLNHNESISPIAGQEDRVEDVETFRVPRFEPYFGLKHLELDGWYTKPLFGSHASYLSGKTKRRENNRKKQFLQTNQSATFSNFAPIPGVSLTSIAVENRESESADTNNINSTTFSGATINYDKINGQVKIKPTPALLQKIDYTWDFFNSKSLTNSQIDFLSGTENITTQRLSEDIHHHNVSFSPGSLGIGFLALQNVRSSYQLKTATKTDRSLLKSFLNGSSIDEGSLTLDDSAVSANIYSLGFAPLGLIDIDTAYTDQNEYYNRNRSTTTIGSLFKEIDDVAIASKASPFSFITLTSLAEFNRLNQQSAVTINITPQALRKGDYDSSLRLDESHANIGGTFSPFGLISFNGTIDHRAFDQTQVSNSAAIKDLFSQDKLTTGVALHIIEGMELFYDFSSKRLQQNAGDFSNGFEDKIGFKYRPINYKNFNVDVGFSKVRSYGFGFNEIERDNLLTASGEVLSVEIRERNDSLLMGNLNININVPLNNVRYLENLIITGEGYVKEIKDEINAGNNLFISGMLIKGTINL